MKNKLNYYKSSETIRR